MSEKNVETPTPSGPALNRPLCTGWPTDKQTSTARRFGEGFTWTCPTCGLVLVLEQGKGKSYTWTVIARPATRLPRA